MISSADTLFPKVLHICTHDSGGAFTAAYRIHLGMRNQNIESKMLVLFQSKTDLVHVYSFLNLKKDKFDFVEWFLMHFYSILTNILFFGLDKTLFSFHFTPFRVEECSLVKEADIVHLHWIAGFINYSTFFKTVKQKIFWTLHDLNPMLGGFHYEIYQKDVSQRIRFLDQWTSKRKKQILEPIKFFTICPSNWILKKTEEFGFGNENRRYQCFYGIEYQEFYPRKSSAIKEKLKINDGEILILFVAEQLLDIRKGLSSVLESINKLEINNIAIVTVGSGSVTLLNKPVFELGRVNNVETMCEIYSACDFMIVPSLEDNLPNIIIEANLCGLPVLGRESSGIQEMIVSGVNGYYIGNDDQMVVSLLNMCSDYKKLDKEEIVKFARNRYEISHIVKLYTGFYENH